MARLVLVPLAACAALARVATALDNGLGLTPALSYSTWNYFGLCHAASGCARARAPPRLVPACARARAPPAVSLRLARLRLF